MAKATLDYKKMNIDDIIGWCNANGKMEWLEKAASQKVPCKVYPKIKVQEYSEKKGKMVTKIKADKTQKPVTEQRDISFVQLKNMFVKTFMPEIMPQKKQTLSMKDKIEAVAKNK